MCVLAHAGVPDQVRKKPHQALSGFSADLISDGPVLSCSTQEGRTGDCDVASTNYHNSSVPRLAYTVSEAAVVTAIPETKIWEDIRTRRLRSFRHGRSRRVSHEALVDYVALLESVTARIENL